MLFEEAVVPRYIVGLEGALISPLLLWYNAKKKVYFACNLSATCTCLVLANCLYDSTQDLEKDTERGGFCSCTVEDKGIV